MIAAVDIESRLSAAGWSCIHRAPDKTTYFRWEGHRRIELHLLFDAAGRLEAWSVWVSERVTELDAEPGRQQRLVEYIESWS